MLKRNEVTALREHEQLPIGQAGDASLGNLPGQGRGEQQAIRNPGVVFAHNNQRLLRDVE
jgi:hypothetical protein